MKVQVCVAKAGAIERLTPRGPKAVAGPRLAVCIAQDRPFRLVRPARVERSLQRGTDQDHDALAALALAKPYVLAVVGGPRDANQIRLSLSCPQGEHQRERQLGRCDRAERRNVL